MDEMTIQRAGRQQNLLAWSQRVADCRSSGLSVNRWCAEHDIRPKTYYDKKYAAYKEQLLPIVSRSTFNFIPQYNFTRMPNQRWMTLEFRTPVPLINAANELEETLGDLFSYVYQEDEYYALGDINIRPLLRAGTEPPVENDVAFQDIQDTIIQGIRCAGSARVV